jgi:hypothetical protein
MRSSACADEAELRFEQVMLRVFTKMTTSGRAVSMGFEPLAHVFNVSSMRATLAPHVHSFDDFVAVKKSKVEPKEDQMWIE